MTHLTNGSNTTGDIVPEEALDTFLQHVDMMQLLVDVWHHQVIDHGHRMLACIENTSN
jgi:hypothetical protein